MPYRDQKSRAAILAGFVGSALVLAALVMFARPAADRADGKAQTRAPSGMARTGAGTARRASPGEVRAYLNDMFDRLDTDGSGDVQLAESPRLQVISIRSNDGTMQPVRLTQAEWFAQGDQDRDGRVSRTEYFVHLVPPVQEIFGVPPDWRPRESDRLDRLDRQG